MDERYIATLLVGDVEPMDPIGAKQTPTHVIVLRMDIDVKAGQIDMSYTGISAFDIGSSELIDDYLKQIALHPDALQWEDPIEKDPDNTKSNLSIRHDGYSYIVIVLESKSWQFTESGPPFLVKKDSNKHYNRFYLDPKCAWVINPLSAVVGQIPPPNANCKVASFIADSQHDPDNDGTINRHFATGFNIFIDLRLKKNGKLRLLPITVDPDVGYPGGNT